MSGTIYMSSAEGSEELDNKWNPLHCHLCHEQYEEPCILRCYHSFCARCLESKVQEDKLACPLCGTITLIKEDSKGPPSDALLKFLVESSSGDKTPCANCDQVQPQMFFCSTCCQSLCLQCREETHQAKMFQTHEIQLQTKHTRDIQKQCAVHKEPYILFSTEKKVMLCINCFRDMKVESRSHCVDLETAYKQGCQKLDDTMQSIRDLQNSARDGILLLRALLEEVHINVEKEKGDIRQLYDSMQEKISETRESLLAEIDRQYEEKVELFKNQLVSLTTFLPTLRVHLVTCAAFSSSANKYEFLDFTYVLMKRLMSIIQVQHPLHPSQTSDIVTEYKVKFAKCLEPLLFPPRNGVSMTVPNPIVPNVTCTRYDVSPCINSPAVNNLGTSQHADGSSGTSKNNQSKKKFKLKLMETKGFFADHCKEFDTSHREFMLKVEAMKQSVQEVQRDITLRRSLTREVTIRELKDTIVATEEGLEVHRVNVQGKQGGLEQHWEESLERIAGEQEVYQAQLQDVARLKNEVVSVKVILQKLSSFVTSIASVTQRLAPKLSKATLAVENDNSHAAILQEINTMQPDSQQRVDAISKAEEDRDIRTANSKVNPLDKELIKTKGLLRAPSLRKESTIKRLSAEIKDVKIGSPDKLVMDKDQEQSEETSNEPGGGIKALGGGIEALGGGIEALGGDMKETSADSVNEKLYSDKEKVETIVNENIDKSSCDCSHQKDHSLKESDPFDRKSAIESRVERGEDALIVVGNDDVLSVKPSSPSLPDLMIQVNEKSNAVTGKSQDINKDICENGELTTMLTLDVTSSDLSGFESDLNTSTESYRSSDEEVKPVMVKDRVEMVDFRVKPLSDSASADEDNKPPADNMSSGITNGGDNNPLAAKSPGITNGGDNNPLAAKSPSITEGGDNKTLATKSPGITEGKDSIPLAAKSPSKNEVEKDIPLVTKSTSITGQTEGVVNNPLANESPSNSETEGNKLPTIKSPAVKGDMASEKDTMVNSPGKDGNLLKTRENVSPSTDPDDDEVYVARSLPELAQVFEAGELKPKRKRRSNKSKTQNDN